MRFTVFITKLVLNNQFFFSYYNDCILRYFENDIAFEIGGSKIFAYYLTSSLLLFNNFMNFW